ncbi:hypothetical protein OD91_1616 [Lutibacter sp. Hel_I_33_5]|uniref:hypothetical protein n=1 Tax=Lutibacter sp. Hel_I_33_5 TaxID=1566289 RepID=UPI0011AA279E|nr:hypothetical protein [Lutibacter sp. Hel_I_33_5]TVZ56331.1 hypothetical protein OD91_1616 [Lutibacter sp. Hel_I_33_5]
MKYLSLLILTLTFSQCATTKFDSNPPFKASSGSFNSWVGGVPGASGIKVELALNADDKTDFKEIFFRNKIGTLQTSTSNGKTILVGHISTAKRNNDLTLDSNSVKELKNQAPETKFPFELKDNEAVISYMVGDKIKYLKIEHLKEQRTIFYPSAKPQGNNNN